LSTIAKAQGLRITRELICNGYTPHEIEEQLFDNYHASKATAHRWIADVRAQWYAIDDKTDAIKKKAEAKAMALWLFRHCVKAKAEPTAARMLEWLGKLDGLGNEVAANAGQQIVVNFNRPPKSENDPGDAM